MAAAVRIAPHNLAFFSDAVGGPGRGHRYLADSNLDWGQDIRTLYSGFPVDLFVLLFGVTYLFGIASVNGTRIAVTTDSFTLTATSVNSSSSVREVGERRQAAASPSARRRNGPCRASPLSCSSIS